MLYDKKNAVESESFSIFEFLYMFFKGAVSGMKLII